MLSTPLVSILTPVFNAEKYLPETINSVLAQTYSNWELLLILDTKSADKSHEICQEFSQRDSRIKMVTNLNCQGVAKNRNEGLKMSQGEYIAFLDSDDLWLPHKLSNQIEFMQKQKSMFSFHDFKTSLGTLRLAPSQVTYQQLLRNNSIGCLTAMVAAAVAKNHQFKPGVHHEDFVYWLEILTEAKVGHGLNECLAVYRIVPGSRSNNKFSSALGRWRIYRDTLKMNLAESVLNMFFYGVSGILKR